MRNATSDDEIHVNDQVMWGSGDDTTELYKVVGVKSGNGLPRLLRLSRPGTEDEYWVEDTDVFVDLDSDEDRQYVHDRLEEQRAYEQELHEKGSAGVKIMGPTFKLRAHVESFDLEEKLAAIHPDMSSPEAILRHATEVLEERGKRYDNDGGSPVITRTADLWSAYLGTSLTETDVCEMMVLHKMARSLQDRAGHDHHLDMVNYSALAGSFAVRASEEDL